MTIQNSGIVLNLDNTALLFVLDIIANPLSSDKYKALKNRIYDLSMRLESRN